MQKKILIIGVKGMAGHVIYKYLLSKGLYKVYGLARNVKTHNKIIDLDVSDTKGVEDLLLRVDFDFVINCIGILNKDAEDHPAKAIWFNGYFPHFLEELTAQTKTQVIHISTDCVFSGKKGGYVETDTKDGQGYYAQSKAIGEIINHKDLTIRTSIIGPELNNQGIGLFNWFINQPQNAKIIGYDQAFWSGVTTLELAKFIQHILQNSLTGLVHLTNGEKIDKQSLLQHFNQVYRNSSIEINRNSTYKVDKSFVNSRTDFNYKVPSYMDMLEELKIFMEESADLYGHYN